MIATDTMRAALIVSLACALGGCQAARSVLGEVQRVGDKGITVGSAAATESTQTASAPADPKRPELPIGLTGDKANRAYTSDAPKP